MNLCLELFLSVNQRVISGDVALYLVPLLFIFGLQNLITQSVVSHFHRVDDKCADSWSLSVIFKVHQSSEEARGHRKAGTSKGSDEFVIPIDS